MVRLIYSEDIFGCEFFQVRRHLDATVIAQKFTESEIEILKFLFLSFRMDDNTWKRRRAE